MAAASAFVRILRVKRTDKSSQPLLLHLTQASTTRPLDLKLVATDHIHIYHGEVKSSQINTLKSDHFSGDEDELRDILLFSLLQTQADGSTLENLQGVELVAASRKEDFEITIRKNIGGITQRIASIHLIQDDEREEVLSFEWVDRAVEISDQQRTELESTQATLDAQRAEISKLKTQLDEFIKIKKEHEDDMLQKFAALLNTKKRRIRELGQLLNHADADHDQVMAEPDFQSAPVKVKPRGSKRKAIQSNDDDVDMDDAEDLEEGPNETPQETEDESEDLNDAPAPKATRPAARASQQRSTQDFSLSNLPPERDLPFTTRSKSANEASVAPVPDDEETDDEL